MRQAYNSYHTKESLECTKYNRDRRPGISYANLITMAIENSAEGMLTLKEIYGWISTHYPYFDSKKTGWQNSIRHNLSLNRCFFKVPRTEGSRGKGSFWKINYDYHTSRNNGSIRKHTSYTAQNGHGMYSSLNEILHDNNPILDQIGVNDIPYKDTSMFSGRLIEDEYYTQDYTAYDDDKSKINGLFTFK